MRRAVIVTAALAAALTLPAAAPAQTPTPPAAGPPPAPDLVLSGRNIRMTRTGVVGVKFGCRTSDVPNEACIGSLSLRLAGRLTITGPLLGQPNGPSRRQTIFPFTLGIIDFTVVEGDSAEVRVRLNRRAQDLIRRQERIRVDLIAAYNSRAGASGSARRNVRVYFPTRPGS